MKIRRLSIRTFLLLHLLIALCITAALAILSNYYLNLRDIQTHNDGILMETAFSLNALLKNAVHPNNVHKIQYDLNKIPQLISHHVKKHAEFYGDENQSLLIKKFQVQVWDKDRNLIFHSATAPTTPLCFSDAEGFTNEKAHGKNWRVFTLNNPETGMRTMVAMPPHIHNELARSMALNFILILLFTVPAGGLVFWIIIGLGLKDLDDVAREVANREPHFLDSVNLQYIPIEIKPLIEEINLLFRRLQQALEREQRFAADAAHELRTPLAALKTQAQVALQTEEAHERKQALKKVIAGVDRSSHIVQQLLTLSRLSPSVTYLEELPKINLSKIAAEAIAHLVPTAVSKNIEIELISQSQNIHLTAHATAMSILIRNLVDNAIRYTPNNGEIKVYLEKKSTQITLRVQDNGPGIPAELRARVFERFYRIIGNTATGSGLGLAIVQQIAQLHGAQVKLDSPSTGTGLIVEVTFPNKK